MFEESRNFMLTATWVVALIFALVIGGFEVATRFHDWDCSRHGGPLNAAAFWTNQQMQAMTPGSMHAEVDTVRLVCKDGYRP